MKKIRLLLVAGLLTNALSAQVTYVTKFNSDDFDFAKAKTVSFEKENYTRFDLSVYPVNATPGNPELPVKYVRLIIPPGQEISDINIEVTEAKTHFIETAVYPIQKPVSVGESIDGFTLPDKSIYETVNPYPSNVVELVSSGYFNGSYHIATFAVYPLQYYPQSKKIIEFNSITFTVNTKVPEITVKKPIAPNEGNLEMYNSLLEGMVDNPEDLNKYPIETIKGSTKSGLSYYKYVIITNSSLSGAFNDFMAWKKLKGIDIGLVTWQDIRANYLSGDLISGITDTAGSIRQYLKDAWQQGTIYCLIGGDMNTVPARFGCGDWDTWDYRYNNILNDFLNKIPTDLYYSDFNGDWNVDGDEYYGEQPDGSGHYGDNVEFEPEIYVGRLLCSNATDVQTWFQKQKLYENNPGNGDFNYLRKVLFTEADGAGSTLIENNVNWTTQLNILHELPSETDLYPTGPSGPSVISEANNLYGLMSWFNHGNPCGVAMYTSGLNQYIQDSKSMIVCKDDWDIYYGYTAITESGNGYDNLTNYNYPSIVYTISCENNPFDDFGTDAGYYNMAEGFTTKSSGGGPAYLGNTREGLGDNSIFLMYSFLNSIQATPVYMQPSYFLQLGVSEGKSKYDYQSHYVCLSHNLIGDPETQFWLNLPLTMYLSVDYINNRARFLTQNGTALMGARVSFNDGGTYHYTTTDYYGYAYANFDLTEDDEIGGSYPEYLPVYTKHSASYDYWTDASPMRGNTYITSGATINIVGNLTIPKYSKLIIEDNATVNLYSGYTLNMEGDIELRGANSKLYVNGTLYVKNNCTISGQGYVKLSGATVNANSGTSLTFTGVSNSTKMIEVNAAVTFSSNLSTVSFSSGEIVMNNSTSRMTFNYPTSSVSFNNVKVTSTTGYLGNMGITIYNVPNVTAQNSTFEYNYYGLYLSRSATNPRAIINNCTFRYCNRGLYVVNSGVTVSYSTFNSNYDKGIYCYSMDQTSSFNHVTCSSNTNYGLYYDGASTSSYSLDYCTFSSNSYGIYNRGPFTMDMECSSSNNNTNYGIEAYNNSNLDIFGSYLYGNKIAIQGDGSSYGNYDNYFTLNDGYNDLRDNGTTGSWCIYGRFWAFGTSPLTVAANNNYWKNGGGAPVNNTDYQVLAEYDLSLTITDNSPESSFTPCSNPQGASMLESSSITSFGLIDEGNYMDVTTSLGTEPLDETVQSILNDDTETGTVYDDADRFELLSELLDNKFDNPNSNEKWYINHAYKKFKGLTGKLAYSSKNIDKALKVVRKIEKDRMKYDKKKVDFSGLIDEALLLDYSGEFDAAISLLQANQSLLDSDDAAYLDELICKIKVDQLVDAGGYDEDIAEAYNQCSYNGTQKSGSDNNGGTGQEFNKRNNIDAQIQLSIMPNPVTGTSVISGVIPEEYAQTELTILNSNGAVVFTESLKPGNVSKTISTSEWAEGIYLVMIRANGQIMNSQKMVIIK